MDRPLDVASTVGFLAQALLALAIFKIL